MLNHTIGDIISTTRDLNTFYAALLGGRLFKPAQLTEMKTTAFDSSYGLGLSKVALPCGTEIWGHTGGIPGYLTFSFHQPETGRYFSLSATSYAVVPDVALFNALTAAFCPSGTPAGTPAGTPTCGRTSSEMAVAFLDVHRYPSPFFRVERLPAPPH